MKLHRLASAAAGLALALPAAALVTVDAPYLYEGAPLPVARLTLENAAGQQAICSGSPIADGRWLLTAAHCLKDTYQNRNWFAQSAVVEIFGSTPYTAQVDDSAWQWHSGWTGSILGGHDIALIRLPSAAPLSFTIDRSGLGDAWIGTTTPPSVLVAGYGIGGQGAQDEATYPAGMLRVGGNHYDAFGTIPGSTYLFDFDDGSSDRNALGLPGYSQVPGYPPSYHLVDWDFDGHHAWAEAMLAPGDSGGPTLFEMFIVTSVHSYQMWDPADADLELNSSFGEIGVDTRVAYFASWIDQVTMAPVPEAPSLALMLAGLTGIVAMRRQRRARGRQAGAELA